MEEIWKPITGTNGKYEVSSFGNIKSVNFRRKTIPRLMLQYTDKYGYKRISLRIKGKNCLKLVHKIVAQEFIPNPNNYPQINHIDEDKANNNVDNLEWCTQEYNNRYGEHGTKISRAIAGKKRIVSKKNVKK